MPKTILVVDDDIDIVEQVSYIVASLGHQVTTAFNRQEAEAKLCSVIPDLAIIDMMMEDKHSGCLLCRHIKRLFPETAVIILSSIVDQAGMDVLADPAHVNSMRQCDAFINKPIHPGQLKKIVEHLLGRPGNRARPDQL